jgi:CheY-like chemotaxis protein
MTNDTAPAVVLLTEDEALVRMYAAEVLIEEGRYKVLEAANADEAMTILHVRPDVRVLCSDIDMPGSMDGIALARVVDMKWPGIGIVLTSGRQRLRPGEVPSKVRFLEKPYTPAALLTVVQELINGNRPIVMPSKEAPALEQGAPFLPVGIKIDQPHTGIGADGGLAQPLQEPGK